MKHLTRMLVLLVVSTYASPLEMMSLEDDSLKDLDKSEEQTSPVVSALKEFASIILPALMKTDVVHLFTKGAVWLLATLIKAGVPFLSQMLKALAHSNILGQLQQMVNLPGNTGSGSAEAAQIDTEYKDYDSAAEDSGQTYYKGRGV